jgi:hypothetical protein
MYIDLIASSSIIPVHPLGPLAGLLKASPISFIGPKHIGNRPRDLFFQPNAAASPCPLWNSGNSGNAHGWFHAQGAAWRARGGGWWARDGGDPGQPPHLPGSACKHVRPICRSRDTLSTSCVCVCVCYWQREI